MRETEAIVLKACYLFLSWLLCFNCVAILILMWQVKCLLSFPGSTCNCIKWYAFHIISSLRLLISCDVFIRVCPIFLKKIVGFGFVCIVMYSVCTGHLIVRFLLYITCFFHNSACSRQILLSVSQCSVPHFSPDLGSTTPTWILQKKFNGWLALWALARKY